MTITGTIHSIGQTVQVSDKFKKREFILITEGNTPYSQHIPLEFTQDKVDLLDGFHASQSVSVEFNLRGRIWQASEGERCFVTLQAWRIALTTT